MKDIFTFRTKEILALEKSLEEAKKIADPVKKLLAHDALHQETGRQFEKLIVSRCRKILFGFALFTTGVLTAGLGGTLAVALPLVVVGGGLFVLMAGRDRDLDLCMKIADTCSAVMDGIIRSGKTPDLSQSPELAKTLAVSPQLKQRFLRASRPANAPLPEQKPEQKNTPPDHFRP